MFAGCGDAAVLPRMGPLNLLAPEEPLKYFQVSENPGKIGLLKIIGKMPLTLIVGRITPLRGGQNDTIVVMLLALPSGAGSGTMHSPSDGRSVGHSSWNH